MEYCIVYSVSEMFVSEMPQGIFEISNISFLFRKLFHFLKTHKIKEKQQRRRAKRATAEHLTALEAERAETAKLREELEAERAAKARWQALCQKLVQF